MLRMDKLTVKAQEALSRAQELAAERHHQQIEPLHLLAALLAQDEGVVPPVLAKLGVRPEAVASQVSQQLDNLPKVTGISQQYLSPATDDVLKRAFDEAAGFKDEFVSTEHLLLALAKKKNDPAGTRGSRRVATKNRRSRRRASRFRKRSSSSCAASSICSRLCACILKSRAAFSKPPRVLLKRAGPLLRVPE